MLKRSEGQQITHQICITILNIFLAINYHSVKKNQQYLSCKTLIFSYVFIALHLKINIV